MMYFSFVLIQNLQSVVQMRRVIFGEFHFINKFQPNERVKTDANSTIFATRESNIRTGNLSENERQNKRLLVNVKCSMYIGSGFACFCDHYLICELRKVPLFSQIGFCDSCCEFGAL